MNPTLESLRAHWFVACPAGAVGRRPLARTIVGLPIVLFRSGGKIAALVDRCLALPAFEPGKLGQPH